MVREFAILLGFQFLGTAISTGTGISIPGNVIGMLLLTMALAFGWIQLSMVERASQLLLENLSFLFVPAGVGIMSYFNILAAEWLSIGISITGSLILVLVITGKGCELTGRLISKQTKQPIEPSYD